MTSSFGFDGRLRRVALALSLVVVPLLAFSCGDDDDAVGDGGAGNGSQAGSAAGSGSTTDAGQVRSGACELGCEATIIADCEMGPKTQLQCETDCERLRTGECGTEYRAYMDCGEGKRVTCDAMGLPTIAACADERSAFIACLN